MSEQYAVFHLQHGSGSNSGMSCHIERKDAKGKPYVPDNADSNLTHLSKELITFPNGVKNRRKPSNIVLTMPGYTARSVRINARLFASS